MYNIYTDKEFKRMLNELNKVKAKCRCGARIILPMKEEKGICHICKNYVFRDKKKEFEYRLKEKIRRNNNE